MESRGTRLRAYLFTATGGTHGWVNELAAASGIKRQTLSAWMGDRSQPDLASIQAIAKVLRVRPFEIVAAMDGDAAVSLTDPTAKELLRGLLEELLAERDARQLPRTPPGRSGAA